MHRRDFLLFKTKGRERVLELSCERLYMRWTDSRSDAGKAAGTGDSHSWVGEPPTDIVTLTTDELFEELERALSQADVVRVIARDWLSDADFRREIESRVDDFSARGGRVE